MPPCYTSLRFLLLRRTVFFFVLPQPPISTLFPYTTLFRSAYPHPPGSGRPGWRREATRPPGFRRRVTGRRLPRRSEEHTSELQSLRHLVCRLLLEKKNIIVAYELTQDQASHTITP